jgi:hypothetical protein
VPPETILRISDSWPWDKISWNFIRVCDSRLLWWDFQSFKLRVGLM